MSEDPDVNYTINWLGQIAIVVFERGFTVENLGQFEEEFFNDSRVGTLSAVIISTLAVDPNPVSNVPFAEYGFLRAFTDATQPMKVAIVSDHPDITDSAENYIKRSKELGNHWEIARFDTLGQAKKWVSNP